MKALFSAVILLSIFTLNSCSNSNIGKQYDFVEPNTAALKSNIGYLRIQTLSYKEKGDYADDPVYDVFKGYSVYTLNGDPVLDVNKAYSEPELVKLPSGEYIVIAELHKNIINSFSVNIETGKILEIDASLIENPYARLTSAK